MCEVRDSWNDDAFMAVRGGQTKKNEGARVERELEVAKAKAGKAKAGKMKSVVDMMDAAQAMSPSKWSSMWSLCFRDGISATRNTIPRTLLVTPLADTPAALVRHLHMHDVDWLWPETVPLPEKSAADGRFAWSSIIRRRPYHSFMRAPGDHVSLSAVVGRLAMAVNNIDDDDDDDDVAAMGHDWLDAGWDCVRQHDDAHFAMAGNDGSSNCSRATAGVSGSTTASDCDLGDIARDDQWTSTCAENAACAVHDVSTMLVDMATSMHADVVG